MKNKCNKIKQTCGTTNYATCIEFEGTPNENSPLSEDCAISAEESIQDIYTQLEEINLSELGEECLEYVLTEDSKIIVKNVLLKYESEICELKTKVADLESTALCSQSIEACNFSWGTLTDSCGEQPATFKDALQLIIDTIQP